MEIDLFLLNTILVVILLLTTCVFHVLMPHPEAFHVPAEDLPSLSVVVPARNEAHNIATCLSSFAEQDYRQLEIIVIDDRSTDDTARIVRELSETYPSIKLIEGTDPPPAGWTGKNFALSRAVEHTSGEWLLFADADTWHEKGSLTTSLSFALARKAHMVSFWPMQELGSFWERVLMPVVWSTFFWSDPIHMVNDLACDKAYAVGHCILISRKAYFAVGGHQSVRDWIIEDHALAKLVKNKGMHVQMCDGRKLVHVRMYTDLASVWHGWTKMLFQLAEYKWEYLCLILLYINSMLVFPFIQAAVLALACFGPAQVSPGQSAYWLAIEIACVAAWYALVRRHYRPLPLPYFLTLPVGGIMISMAYLYSALLVVFGLQVSWKGRQLSAARVELPDSPVL